MEANTAIDIIRKNSKDILGVKENFVPSIFELAKAKKNIN